MRGVEPAKSIGAKPEIRWVDPRSLLIEESYQRGIRENGRRLIRRIVAGWSWARFKPPIVAPGADGSLYIIDGQHTAIAAVTHGGIGKIPVLEVGADTVPERAHAFLGHNRDRLGVTQMQMHHALVAAGDEIALAMESACKKAGATICQYQPKEFDLGETIAVRAIRDIVTNKGAPGGARVLKCLIDAERAPLAAVEIKAAAEILFSRDPVVETAALSEAIGRQPSEEWRRRAHRRREDLSRPNMQLWSVLVMLWREELKRAGKIAA